MRSTVKEYTVWLGGFLFGLLPWVIDVIRGTPLNQASASGDFILVGAGLAGTAIIGSGLSNVKSPIAEVLKALVLSLGLIYVGMASALRENLTYMSDMVDAEIDRIAFKSILILLAGFVFGLLGVSVIQSARREAS